MRFTSGKEYMNWEGKKLAFIGMSGVGKSALSSYLDPANWTRVCTDFDLAVGPLRPELENFAGIDFPVGHDDISILSSYVGKLGKLELGGLDFVTFKERQQRHAIAERQTFEELIDKLKQISGSAIIDAGGSLVEILDFENNDPLRESLAELVFFVFIEATPDEVSKLIKRQLAAPKPMFYQPDFLNLALTDFGRAIEDTDPDEFIRFVFPRLCEHRAPRYRALAQEAGVRVTLADANRVRTDSELHQLIVEAIDNAN